MHYRATLDIINRKGKIIGERIIFVRADNIMGVLDVVRKIRGAKLQQTYAIPLNIYQKEVAKQM